MQDFACMLVKPHFDNSCVNQSIIILFTKAEDCKIRLISAKICT
ncbi:unnamed protein product [Staurois parvus]|uniref:Uncharacterized protein n=1 Tax=Staurois parvus TaxID=386267 RepID=A0ABN9ES93_9NEOB|nr:unnamed protein product [Staurois parvus]